MRPWGLRSERGEPIRAALVDARPLLPDEDPMATMALSCRASNRVSRHWAPPPQRGRGGEGGGAGAGPQRFSPEVARPRARAVSHRCLSRLCAGECGSGRGWPPWGPRLAWPGHLESPLTPLLTPGLQPATMEAAAQFFVESPDVVYGPEAIEAQYEYRTTRVSREGGVLKVDQGAGEGGMLGRAGRRGEKGMGPGVHCAACLQVHPTSTRFTFRTARQVPRLGVMLVGWGGNNGSTLTAAVLANRLRLSWPTRSGRKVGAGGAWWAGRLGGSPCGRGRESAGGGALRDRGTLGGGVLRGGGLQGRETFPGLEACSGLETCRGRGSVRREGLQGAGPGCRRTPGRGFAR